MTDIIMTIRLLIKALTELKNDGFITVIDEDSNEYVIANVIKVKRHGDDARDWNYALKIRRSDGCIKR